MGHAGYFGPIAWSRGIFDLDAPGDVGRVLDRDRPEVVIHCAAQPSHDWAAKEPITDFTVNALALSVVEGMAGEITDLFDGQKDLDKKIIRSSELVG